MSFTRTLVVASLAASVAASVSAQTVIAGGDNAPTFPITISKPGNYRLAADLVVPAGVDGIVVTADHVTIDLNGRSVRGAGLCSGGYVQLSCTGTNTGIWGQKRNLTVRNGRVAGFSWGVAITNGGLVEDLAVEHNAANCLAIYNYGIARGIRAFNNVTGIDAKISMVRDSNIGYSTVGIRAMGGLVQGVQVTSAVTGMYGLSSTTGFREMSISASTPLAGSLATMGHNLCNGAPC